MADSSDLPSRNTTSPSAPSSLSALRTLAQSHLIEIETEKTEEALDQERRMKHLQRYVKISRKEREKNERVKAKSSSASTSTSALDSDFRSASNSNTNTVGSRGPTLLATNLIDSSNGRRSNEDIESHDGESGGASLSLMASNASRAETAEEAARWSQVNGSIPTAKSTPLRPVQDILSRLRWDTTLSLLPHTTNTPITNPNSTTTTNNDSNPNPIPLSAYKIGYIERFTGIQELPASNWITESTDEDFIPLHRIRYIKLVVDDDDTVRGKPGESKVENGKGGEEVMEKEKGEKQEKNEGVREIIIWDRDERVDLVFGSGRSGSTTTATTSC